MKIEDAIKRYESWAEDDRIDILIRKEHRQMADWLKELKTDRPRGKWIDISEWYSPRQKCSICGEIVEGYGSNFCPNCGADMRGINNVKD